ncbi:MAG: hypothetical protein ACYC1Z_03565 [Georgenia sp.]
MNAAVVAPAPTSADLTDREIARSVPRLDIDGGEAIAAWSVERMAVRGLAIACDARNAPLAPADVLRIGDSLDAIARAYRWEHIDDLVVLVGAR